MTESTRYLVRARLTYLKAQKRASLGEMTMETCRHCPAIFRVSRMRTVRNAINRSMMTYCSNLLHYLQLKQIR